jgi:hypothetical protein
MGGFIDTCRLEAFWQRKLFREKRNTIGTGKELYPLSLSTEPNLFAHKATSNALSIMEMKKHEIILYLYTQVIAKSVMYIVFYTSSILNDPSSLATAKALSFCCSW